MTSPFTYLFVGLTLKNQQKNTLFGPQHCRPNYLRCLNLRWPWMVSPGQLEPNEFIQGINPVLQLAWLIPCGPISSYPPSEFTLDSGIWGNYSGGACGKSWICKGGQGCCFLVYLAAYCQWLIDWQRCFTSENVQRLWGLIKWQDWCWNMHGCSTEHKRPLCLTKKISSSCRSQRDPIKILLSK